MAISEKIELLGKGLYKDIPDVLTLKAIPTASELDYVGSEDFYATMLDNIFPKAIEEQCNFRNLLEIDFHWICRCLRMLNYGYYYTTSNIYCYDCRQISYGEYRVDLRTVEVKPLPDKFTNKLTISRSEFLDFDGDIVISLPTIQDIINAEKDPLFKDANGDMNRELARICYMVKSIKGDSTIPTPNVKFTIQNTLTSADYIILKSRANELTDYGLRAGGSAVCPKCHSTHGGFVALVDDRFFRPTLGDLRSWKADRDAEVANKSTTGTVVSGFGMENISSITPAKV